MPSSATKHSAALNLLKHTLKPSPCRCTAYPFPHRWLGGKCQGEEAVNWNRIYEAQEGYHERH